MVKKALALVVLTSLIGCSAVNTLTVTNSYDDKGDPVVVREYSLTDTGIYHKSIADSTKDKRLLAEKQAEEIRLVDISTQSTDAQALLNKEKIDNIGGISTTAYEGAAPTTYVDVAKTVVGVVPSLVTGTVQGVAIVEAGKTLRTALDKDSVSVIDSDNTVVEITKEDNDQTQVATSNEGGATNAPQGKTKGAEDEGVGSVEEGVDSGCTAEAPIMYNGTCYSQESVEERGFPVD